MNTSKITGLAGVAIILMIGFAVISLFIGTRREEIGLRTRYEAQTENVVQSHDKMWKTISEKFSLAGFAADTIIEQTKARTAGQMGGTWVKSFTESGLEFGLPESLLTEISRSSESLRKQLFREQQTLLDIYREYQKLIQDPVKKIFLGQTPEVKAPVLITSSRSRNAAETGVDDEVMDFSGRKKESADKSIEKSVEKVE